MANWILFFFLSFFLCTDLWTIKWSHGEDIRKTKPCLLHLISCSHLIYKEMNLKNYTENKFILQSVSAIAAQQFALTTLITSSMTELYSYPITSIHHHVKSTYVRVHNAFLSQCLNRCFKLNAVGCWKQKPTCAALQVKAECQIPLC